MKRLEYKHTITYTCTLDFNYEASIESLHVHIHVLHKLINDERNELYLTILPRISFFYNDTTPFTSQGHPHPVINLWPPMRLF